jgi:hypothetical protein
MQRHRNSPVVSKYDRYANTRQSQPIVHIPNNCPHHKQKHPNSLSRQLLIRAGKRPVQLDPDISAEISPYLTIEKAR